MIDIGLGVLEEFTERSGALNPRDYTQSNGFRVCRASPEVVREWWKVRQAETKAWRARVNAELVVKYGRSR